MEGPGIGPSDVRVPETERREDLPDEHVLSKPGEVFYLHTTPRSLILARTVDGTVHESSKLRPELLDCWTPTLRVNYALLKPWKVTTPLSS